jgi:membrane-bound transcription factor site-1 protease
MYILLFTALSLVKSYEVILEFDHYSTRSSLFSSLPTDIQSSLQIAPGDLSYVTNFLVVSIDPKVILKGIPSLKAVYPQKKLGHRPLTFLSESNGYKITDLIEANVLWEKNLTGKGVKIGILDSGISIKDKNYINVFDCINFTDDYDCDDKTGHGTFMASLVVSSYPECPGIAPGAEVYSLKVFSSTQESYTSWFLDAFNYAKDNNITILSLSNGGIDFMDEPFVSKISELVALGITVVSAAGNDGPGFGTLTNPGDQPEVIGVGGLDETGLHVADFSSRGPSLWEINGGMGRFKPDIVTYSVNIKGFYMGRCISNHGTSVSTPIIAASIALLSNKKHHPSVIKQALVSTATKLQSYSIFEQGAGKLNLLKAKKYLDSFIPALMSFPAYFNNYEDYFFPYSLQPLYALSPPIILNFTITHPYLAFGNAIVLNITNSPKLYTSVELSPIKAYTSSLSVFISALEPGSKENITIVLGCNELTTAIPITLKLGPNPRKQDRVLWDLGHNLKFPEAGPVLRDEIEGTYLFDWKGDHPFTNLLNVYETMIEMEYVVDFLYDDFSCIDGSLYSVYLIIDPEKSYTPYEINKIQYDMETEKVSLVLFAEWSDYKTLDTQLALSNYTQGIPGSNIETINNLLSPYFIEFSRSKSFSDTGRIGHQKFSVRFI